MSSVCTDMFWLLLAFPWAFLDGTWMELCSRVQPHEDEVDEYLKLDQLTDTNEW